MDYHAQRFAHAADNWSYELGEPLGIAAFAGPYEEAALQPKYAGLAAATGVAEAVVAGDLPAAARPATAKDPPRPLKVIHVGQFMVRAGIEIWLKALVRGANPARLRFQRCIVTSPLNDPRVIHEMPVPVEVGEAASVRHAALDCDVLLVSGPADVAAWLGATRPPLCVFVAHGHSSWAQRILRECAPIIDHVVAVSEHVQRHLCPGFPSSVIYNGVDPAHLTRAASRQLVRSRFGFAAEDFVVGSVTRLATEKNVEQLVAAIARLPRRCKLFLVGWGPLRQKLLHLANELAPLRCVIAAASENLGDYYSAFDAFCMPSESEGFSLATLEALLCGVPVITLNTGFAPELLLDRVHYLQCGRDAPSIAAAIETLMHHPDWAFGMAAQGRKAAEHFGYADRMCRQYEDLLLRLWNNRTDARGCA